MLSTIIIISMNTLVRHTCEQHANILITNIDREHNTDNRRKLIERKETQEFSRKSHLIKILSAVNNRPHTQRIPLSATLIEVPSSVWFTFFFLLHLAQVVIKVSRCFLRFCVYQAVTMTSPCYLNSRRNMLNNLPLELCCHPLCFEPQQYVSQ